MTQMAGRDLDRTELIDANPNWGGILHHLPGLAGVPIVGIIRGYQPEAAIEAARIAVDAGLAVIEVTLDSPGAVDAISTMSSELGVDVGAGTVSSASQVHSVVDAGARFVVTPAFSEEVVGACVDLGIPVVPGVATPTEIVTALAAGAPAVKIFPARELGGPDYLKAIVKPLGSPPMIPTGGVVPSDARRYLENGAVAVGAGSALFPLSVAERRDWRELEALSSRWVEAVN